MGNGLAQKTCRKCCNNNENVATMQMLDQEGFNKIDVDETEMIGEKGIQQCKQVIQSQASSGTLKIQSTQQLTLRDNKPLSQFKKEFGDSFSDDESDVDDQRGESKPPDPLQMSFNQSQNHKQQLLAVSQPMHQGNQQVFSNFVSFSVIPSHNNIPIQSNMQQSNIPNFQFQNLHQVQQQQLQRENQQLQQQTKQKIQQQQSRKSGSSSKVKTKHVSAKRENNQMSNYNSGGSLRSNLRSNKSQESSDSSSKQVRFQVPQQNTGHRYYHK